VLNADNEWTADMARLARGEIIFFSMEEDNPVLREHLRARGRAVVLRQTRNGEMITIIEHRRETSLLLVHEIPATFDGRLRVNIANAMAAAAVALGENIQLEYIRQALRTFTTSFFQTPGRFNVMEFQGRRVIMDYCHNVAGMESMTDFVRRLEPERTIAVISIPGDRQDEDIHAYGTLAAAAFDELILREDSNRRGRQNGEIAALLKDAAVAGGMPEDKITIILEEIEAVREAVQRSAKDDLIVLMIDKPASTWEELERLAGRR
jgi:cyanophycin synthetase